MLDFCSLSVNVYSKAKELNVGKKVKCTKTDANCSLSGTRTPPQLPSDLPPTENIRS